MNQRLSAVLFTIGSSLVASSVTAAPPECVDPPGQGGKPGKATILHCACNDSGDGLEYVEIRVSSKSRGHRKHLAGSIDSCGTADSDAFIDFVRSGSDCQLDGPALRDNMALCSDQFAGQACGTEVID